MQNFLESEYERRVFIILEPLDVISREGHYRQLTGGEKSFKLLVTFRLFFDNGGAEAMLGTRLPLDRLITLMEEIEQVKIADLLREVRGHYPALLPRNLLTNLSKQMGKDEAEDYLSTVTNRMFREFGHYYRSVYTYYTRHVSEFEHVPEMQ